jgi:hypothetical protein
MTLSKIEIWADTGESVKRDYTREELAQHKADQKNVKEDARERAADEARQAETRAAAIEHAKTLGFTDAMLAVMYPNLIASE